ncbi:hypothetical protein LTR05_000070 [Lithohypha guttulata]|uniref:Uncharacterized protein n=1 Tax=Lithohypha guttulata TaxID=1690604 RepID=A0AAN7T4I5_9EURO|nr:hypothetical protein LTR05_000070 [Lithohypha guttulata]
MVHKFSEQVDGATDDIERFANQVIGALSSNSADFNKPELPIANNHSQHTTVPHSKQAREDKKKLRRSLGDRERTIPGLIAKQRVYGDNHWAAQMLSELYEKGLIASGEFGWTPTPPDQGHAEWKYDLYLI